MRCFWCEAESELVTEDHVIPRSLGGTREYIVPACEGCQVVLSKAEQEVARKSFMALAALSSGVDPRHPDRPTSGLLRPTYLLVKHPLGGYGETILSAGERLAALPHVEIKVVPGEPLEGRVRGPSAEGAQRLIDTFRKLLANPRGPGNFVCEMTASSKLDPEIRDDPDFWPRVVLLPGDRLVVRGRDPEEMMRFARAFTALLTSGYNVDLAAWKQGEDIKAGTIHKIGFDFDPQCVRRIAAKVGYSMFRLCTGRTLSAQIDKQLRDYVLGLSNGADEPVWVEPHPVTMTTSDRPHIVLLSPTGDPAVALVSLYGYRFRVELGHGAELPAPIVILCKIDGSGIICRTDPEQVEAAIAQFQGTEFGQSWRQPQKLMAEGQSR